MDLKEEKIEVKNVAGMNSVLNVSLMVIINNTVSLHVKLIPYIFES